MILLKEYVSEIDADNLAERLRRKGVFTHVSGKQSKQLGALVTGAVKVGVWAVLDHQVKDAIALLSNNKHQVENPLTEEEMVDIEVKMASTGGDLSDIAIKALAVIALLGFGVYVLLK